MMEFVPFSIPSLGEEEEHAVLEVLRSGWITTGPKCAEFEKSFAEYVGAKHAVALTSATGGLHIVLSALGVGPGDEVITPSMNWCSTPNMIRLLGATPVFVDIDAHTLNIDPEDLARVLSPKTKAFVPVHFAGRAYDVDVGTRYKGRSVGSLADISCFSFHPIKNMTTGEGGMVTCSDDELARKLKLWKFHGVSRDAFKRYSSKGLPHYDIEFSGYKYNMTDIQAAIGVEQLKKLDAFNAERALQVSRYREWLRDVPLILPPPESREDCFHAWHLFIVGVTDESPLSRDELMIQLKERNVGTGLHFLPVHKMSAFEECIRGLPATEHAGERILSLPLFPGLTEEKQRYVADQIVDLLSKS
jgi:UDP-4-amino-4-deoxy-L-arabinose-oxoglutarate aminotransferase